MKGVPQQELERLPNDINVEQIIPLQVPGLAAARCLIMLTTSPSFTSHCAMRTSLMLSPGEGTLMSTVAIY